MWYEHVKQELATHKAPVLDNVRFPSRFLRPAGPSEIVEIYLPEIWARGMIQ
jgi:hypothetical protein